MGLGDGWPRCGTCSERGHGTLFSRRGWVGKVRIEKEGEIVRRVRRRGRASPGEWAWISDGGSRELVPSMILVLGSCRCLFVQLGQPWKSLGHRTGHLLGVGEKHLIRWPDDKQLISRPLLRAAPQNAKKEPGPPSHSTPPTYKPCAFLLPEQALCDKKVQTVKHVSALCHACLEHCQYGSRPAPRPRSGWSIQLSPRTPIDHRLPSMFRTSVAP